MMSRAKGRITGEQSLPRAEGIGSVPMEPLTSDRLVERSSMVVASSEIMHRQVGAGGGT